MDQDLHTLIKLVISIEEKLSVIKMTKKDILDFSEACKYLNLSESHSYRLTSQRLISYYRPNGKKIYFMRSALDEWMQTNQVMSLSEMKKLSGE